MLAIMNRLLSLSLALSFALTGCSLNTSVGESEDNGDFLSEVQEGDVLIIAVQSFGIGEEELGLDSDNEMDIWLKLNQNANELAAFYREEKNANVDKEIVHALVSKRKDRDGSGLDKEEFDLYDNSPPNFTGRQLDFWEIENPDGVYVDSLLEVLVEKKKSYDRIIIMAPAHSDGPVFSKNLVPGVNYPRPDIDAYAESAKRVRYDFMKDMYGTLGKLTNPGGWIYFTGVNPDRHTGFDGFNNFLDMASCLTGRHTVASRTDSLMWKEHTRVMKIDRSNDVDEELFTEGIRLQTPCDATQDAGMSCRRADSNLTCSTSSTSYTRAWGECPSGTCVDVLEDEKHTMDNTVAGLCPGPAHIRCSQVIVEVGDLPPAPSNVRVHNGEPERCGRGKGMAGWCVDTSVGNDVGDCETVSRLSSMTEGACFGGEEIRCCPDNNIDGLPIEDAPIPTDDGGTPILGDGEPCTYVDDEDQSTTQGVCLSENEIMYVGSKPQPVGLGECQNIENPVCVFIPASDDGTDYGLGWANNPDSADSDNVDNNDGKTCIVTKVANDFSEESESFAGVCQPAGESCDGRTHSGGGCAAASTCCVSDSASALSDEEYVTQFTEYDKCSSPDNNGFEPGATRCVPREIQCKSLRGVTSDSLIHFYESTPRDFCPNDGDDYVCCPYFE